MFFNFDTGTRGCVRGCICSILDDRTAKSFNGKYASVNWDEELELGERILSRRGLHAGVEGRV